MNAVIVGLKNFSVPNGGENVLAVKPRGNIYETKLIRGEIRCAIVEPATPVD